MPPAMPSPVPATMPPAPPGTDWIGPIEDNEARVYEALVRHAGVPGCTVARLGGAVALRLAQAPSALVFNRVLGGGVHAPVDEAWLEQVLAHYGDAGFGIEIAEAWCTPPLLGWLRDRRLHRLGRSQMVVCDTGRPRPPGNYESWARHTGLRIERVGDEHGATLAALCCENFGVPALLGELVAAGAAGPGWRRWLAFDGDEAVGGSLSHVGDDGVGWFGWTSVRASHRGRWVHTGFVARQLDDAIAAGCRWVSTDTAQGTRQRPDPVHLGLRRFGFVDAHLRPFFVRAPRRRAG